MLHHLLRQLLCFFVQLGNLDLVLVFENMPQKNKNELNAFEHLFAEFHWTNFMECPKIIMGIQDFQAKPQKLRKRSQLSSESHYNFFGLSWIILFHTISPDMAGDKEDDEDEEEDAS